ncbi:MAG: lamin tail domain-containing protein [Planctomycetota bacterium]
MIRSRRALLRLWAAAFVVFGAAPSSPLEALVISEILYHPADRCDDPGSGCNPSDYEFIELYNDRIDPLDLSGWRFVDGIYTTFPEGTWLDGKSFLVVCGNLAKFRERYPDPEIRVIGPWEQGRLDNGGERISLANAGGRVVLTLRYNDRDEWPAGADGTGHSLSLMSPLFDPDDGKNWAPSLERGGTPGKPNSPAFPVGTGTGAPASGLDPSGFIVKWLFLGPYTGAGCGIGTTRLNADWLRESAGGVRETDLFWRDGQVVRTDYALAESTGLHPNAGTSLPTVRARGYVADTINLNDVVYPPDPENVMAYAFVYVDNVTSSAIPVDIALASDDAVVVLVNGVRVHTNDVCRAGGNSGEIQDRAAATLAVGKNLIAVKVFEQGGAWNFRLRLEGRGTGVPIKSKAKIQITTDPDQGLLFGGGGTPIWPPEDEEEPGGPTEDPRALFASPVVVNEGFLSATGESWIEIYNRTSSAYDLSGHHVTNDPRDLAKATLSAGAIVPAGGFLVLTASELGLDLTPRVAGGTQENRFVALSPPGAQKILDAANFRPTYAGYSEARVPDGDWEFRDGCDPTPGAESRVSANADVVLNEVMYHPIDNDDDKEYVELYNRGSYAVDLSGWSFTRGINFTFSPGTAIPAGGYLVVARDPAKIRAIYGLSASEVVGPKDAAAKDAFGRLRDRGERITLKDHMGRTVDTVRFHDGGEWPRWADGHGSSMELVDAFADNSVGQAWDASDDSAKAETREYLYVGRHGGGESELAMLLLASGIAIVDDVSVKNAAGTNLVTNGTFETDARGWIIEGNHIRTGRTTKDPISGAASLKLIATGRGDNKVNRIETPEASGYGLATLPTGQDLRISFKARWVVGSPTLLTHGYEHAMAKAHALAVPPNLGTPGRLNSVTARLIAREGSANLGPVISDVKQSPIVPGAGEAVTVRARIADPDGVASATLYYSLGNPRTSGTPISMRPAGGGLYEATIPGQALGTRVVFSIRATDGLGKVGRYPLDVVSRTHPQVLDPDRPNVHDHLYAIYKHDVRDIGAPYLSYRFFMSDADELYLDSRANLSNDPIPGTFLWGAERIYYNSATRFSGSPFARGKWGSMRVYLPRDAFFHEPMRKFNLDNHHGTGADARERISHYLLSLGQGAIGVPYSDAQTLVRWQVNGRGVATLERVWVPDVQFLGLSYPEDDDGPLYEMDDRFVVNDAGNMVGNTDASVRYPPPSSRSDGDGETKENYRWFFGLRTREGLDDFRPLIELARLLDPSVTTDAQLDAQLFERVNVEEFLRVWAVRYNTDDWDEWGANRGKNCYLYLPPGAGRWELIPWDMELTYGGTGAYLPPANPSDSFQPANGSLFPEVNRLFRRPAVKRMYYAILREMVSGAGRWFHSDRVAPHMSKLSEIGMYNTDKGMPGGFIDQRAALLEPRVRSVGYPQVRMAITTKSGADFSTANPTESFQGNAPVDAATIVVVTNGTEIEFYPVRFPTLTTWRIDDVVLVPGRNQLEFLGFDLRGNLVDSDSIVVTANIAAWTAPAISSIVPPSALPGMAVEVLGTGFHNRLKVFFGSAQATEVSYDERGSRPDRILATVPRGSGTVLVTVRNLDGQTSAGVPFAYAAPPSTFLRGDANGDGRVDVSDPVKILLYLFGGALADCEDALDVDDDETISLTDAVWALDYLFKSGPAPLAPFPDPGVDPSGEALGCER